jgi:hypothetical protein
MNDEDLVANIVRMVHLHIGNGKEPVRVSGQRSGGEVKSARDQPRQPVPRYDWALKVSGRILEIDGMLGTLELVRNFDWATVVASIAVTDEVKQGGLVDEPIYGPCGLIFT